jgi:valyl-tRNA synthetase
VRKVFVDLHAEGLIYQGERLINWCPRCHTALANDEVVHEEHQGHFWDFAYPLADEDGDPVVIATTRPETMLGDTAVAVNPDDERYRALVGADVTLPLADRTIPVIADAYVDPEFGTGMVKVTPAHDPNDFEMAERAGIPLLNVMTDHAVMNDAVPESFRGLDRFEARKEVLKALDAGGLLAGEDPHMHTVPRCYRCDTVVEPRLSLQWFVRMEPLAKPALQASRDGTLSFTPERWKKVYDHWMENIRDWCISRQLWWGHRIPVWYCNACEGMHVLRDDPEVCPECGSGDLRQDPDVLDTWFSSWLWPMSPFGWPEDTPDLEAFYPGHTLVTAPEILFFWVARMIMAGYEFMGEPPFTEVFLHGTVRDARGRKMSKSLGNGIDPMEVVERFGADAMRFTLISQCAIGTDIQLDNEDIENAFASGRNFANKVWNAGRFTLMSVGDDPVRSLNSVRAAMAEEDRWILSRLAATTREVTSGMERYRLHEVAERLYHFFWGELADWYLELVKGRLRGEAGGDSREAARTTLVTALDGVLTLLHPIIPFVTTALWDRLPWPEGRDRPEDLMMAAWPDAPTSWDDPEAERRLTELQELITSVRSLRKEYGVGEGERVTLHVADASGALRESLSSRSAELDRLARVGELLWDRAPDGAIGAHAVLRGGAELFLPLEGVVDLDRERARLADEIARLEGQLRGTEAKLANEQFVQRAPAEVVQKERDKAAGLTEQLAKLRTKLALFQGRG